MNEMVFRNISYGLYVISAMDGDRPAGCIANSIMQITAVPATMAISVNHDNFTHSCIRKTKGFAISILSEGSDPGLIGNFGFQSGKEVNKFEKIPHEMKSGFPIISDSCGYLVCQVIDTLETPTHTVFLAKVTDGETIGITAPMTYAYYHKVIKGKSPKNAPTYLPEADKGQSFGTKYVCSVCGYIYEGETPFNELSVDYRCPVCKATRDKFVEK